MPKHKLTAKWLDSVKAPKGQVDYFDATLPAFSVRVTSSGVKTFTVFYRVDGKQVRQTIGRYPAISLADARRKAADAFQLVEQGKDPRLVLAHQRRAEALQRADTVRAVATRF